MVGHYEQDPIAGPKSLIDRELLDGDLSERHSLGLYAGPRGTAIGGAACAQRTRASAWQPAAVPSSPASGTTTAR